MIDSANFGLCNDSSWSKTLDTFSTSSEAYGFPGPPSAGRILFRGSAEWISNVGVSDSGELNYSDLDTPSKNRLHGGCNAKLR
jgi:hypothetical protein